MKKRAILLSAGIGLLVAAIAAAVVAYRTPGQPDPAMQAAQIAQVVQIAKAPEAAPAASKAKPSDAVEAATALARGLDSGAQAFKALSQDQNNVKAGKLTELQSDDRSRTVHAPRFRRVMQDLAAAKFPPGDPRAAFAQDYTRLVTLVLEGLTMDSKVVDGKPLPVNPARAAAIEAEIQQLNARIPKEMEELKTLQAVSGLK